MTLREKQSAFAASVAALIQHAIAIGFEVTLGEAYRPPAQAARMAAEGKGIKNSLHTDKLAIDLNLFKNGVFLEASSAHQALGEWWEQRSTPELQFCWGGRFGDGNHYSCAHNGRK